MKLKKALAMLLTTAMVLSMMTVGAFATENEENGVMPISNTEQTAPVSTLPADATNSWAASSIDRWSTAGIVKGDADGNFNPDAQLSRAELAQIFVNMLGLTEKGTNTFADLKGTEWYADAILKCAAAGIMKGDGVSANAETQISRQETVVMFGRAVGVTPDAKPDMSTFTDGNTVADWAAGYMAPLTKMGILAGSGDGTINAVGHIDRASTMALLDKSISEYVNAPGEYKVDDAKKFVVVNMAAKEGEIVISGTTAGVTVSAGTAEGKIVAKDLKADTIKMDGAAALNVEGKSSVGQVTANATGTVTIAKGVTVDTLNVNAAAKVTNNGTVNTANFNEANSTWSGNKPKEVVPGPGITPPVTEQPSGGGGGSTGPSVTYADVVKANLHDTRGDVSSAAAGTFVADNEIATGYNVTGGAESTTGDVTTATVTVTANHLMQHKAGDAGLGYWVGVGVNAAETATAAVGWGECPAQPSFDALANKRDNTMVQNGKTYSTFYFNADGADSHQTGYIAIKTAEGKTTIYNVNFSAVTCAEPIENLKIWVVKDKASYDQIPEAYINEYPWDDSYAMTESTCKLPWLAVTYDSNTASAFNIAITKNNVAVTVASGTGTSGTNSINKDRYQLWHLSTQTGDFAAKPQFTQTVAASYGTYALTITKDGKSFTSNTVNHLDADAVYHTVTFDGAQSVMVKAGDTITAPVTNPTKTGYTFGDWYTDVTTEGTKLTSGTTPAGTAGDAASTTIAYVAKWTPNQYTITFDANGGTGTANSITATYDVAIGTLPSGLTKTGYAFGGWTKTNNGTDFVTATDRNLVSTGSVTLFAKWTAKDCTLAYALNYTAAPAAPASKTVKFGAVYGTLPTPTRTGYTLVGWYAEAGCTTSVSDATTIAAEGTTTIYAKWASAATFTDWSSALYTIYKNDSAFGTNMPATRSAFGTDLTYTPGVDDATKIAVTGTLNYVTGWTGFNSTTVAEQNGYYAMFQVAAPSDVAAAPAVIITRPHGGSTKDLTADVLDPVDGGTKYYSIVLYMTYEADSGFKNSYEITFDWDGSNASAVTPTTYTLDFSAVERQDVSASIVDLNNTSALTATAYRTGLETYDITITGTDVASGIPDVAEVKALFLGSDVSAQAGKQTALTSAIGKHTVVAINWPAMGLTAGTTYKRVQTNEALKGFSLVDGIKTTEHLGSYFDDLTTCFVMSGTNNVKMEIKDGSTTLMTFNFTNSIGFAD